MDNDKILNSITNILKEKKIKFETEDNGISISFVIGDEKVLVVIAVLFVDTGVVCIAFYENKFDDIYKKCSEINSKKLIPKVYVFEDSPQQIISECSYDLKIFPDDYIGKWFSSALDAHLATFKEIYNIK